jgi:hypothetical protein
MQIAQPHQGHRYLSHQYLILQILINKFVMGPRLRALVSGLFIIPINRMLVHEGGDD